MTKQEITPQMRQFLVELADLLAKHGVEIEATEECRGYETYCDGIEFTQDAIYADGETTRPWSCLKTGRMIDADDVRKLAQ